MIAFIGDVHREFDQLAGAVAQLPAGVEAGNSSWRSRPASGTTWPDRARRAALEPPSLLRHRKSRLRAVLPRGHPTDRDGAQSGVRSEGNVCWSLTGGGLLSSGAEIPSSTGRVRRDGVDWWPEERVTMLDVARFERCRPGGFPGVPHSADFRLSFLWLSSRSLGSGGRAGMAAPRASSGDLRPHAQIASCRPRASFGGAGSPHRLGLISQAGRTERAAAGRGQWR